MSELIAEFAGELVKSGYFDNFDKDDKLFYKNSHLRKNNTWYERCKVSKEILTVQEKLDSLIDKYCEKKTLHELLKNKNKIKVFSIPNTKFTLLDFFFCKYLERQYPHLSVELIKMLPIDNYHFLNFDEDHLGDSIEHVDHPRTKKFVISISENDRNHIFTCDKDGYWY